MIGFANDNQEGPSPSQRRREPQARRFACGRILITRGAAELLTEWRIYPTLFLVRHMAGDWGEVDDEDWAANDRAVDDSQRLLSVYVLRDDQRLWIITEGDRSVTTLLLPSCY